MLLTLTDHPAGAALLVLLMLGTLAGLLWLLTRLDVPPRSGEGGATGPRPDRSGHLDRDRLVR